LVSNQAQLSYEYTANGNAPFVSYTYDTLGNKLQKIS